MSNYVKYPLVLPIKWVPFSGTPGVHFDDLWAYRQVRDYQIKARYFQKWKRSETTKIQIESTIAPQDMKILGADGLSVKTIPWTNVFTNAQYSIYELTFDVSDLPEGIYFGYSKVTLLSFTRIAITEPINSRNEWPNTMSVIYKHSFNDYDVAWSTGIEMKFRVECGIMDIDPQRNAVDYINQNYDNVLLSAVPFRAFKLLVGDAPGVAPWVIDLLNRIMDCDYTSFEGKRYSAISGSKWEITRAKGYPLVGGSLDIMESINNMSMEMSDTTPLAPGLVTAYEIQTGFFGAAAIVNVEEVEKNS